jgi:glutathione S-transferase
MVGTLSKRPSRRAEGSRAQEAPVLWHLKFSNFNEKARWALDYKKVPHLRRAVVPGRQRAVAQRLSGTDTFPVLVLGGEAIGDSTQIIEALERRYPDPQLYPSDPPARRRALELEDFFDEELGPFSRLLTMSCLLKDADLMLGAAVPELSGPRFVLARATFPRIRRGVIATLGIDDFSVEHAYVKLRAAAERFREALHPSGYLVGDSFTVADLTLAALLAPPVAPEQFPYPQPQRTHPALAPLRAVLAESGLFDWTREIYARHRSPSAEVAPAEPRTGVAA